MLAFRFLHYSDLTEDGRQKDEKFSPLIHILNYNSNV